MRSIMLANISEMFKVYISDDKLSAEIHCTDKYVNEEIGFSKATFIDFLKSHQILHGLIKKNVDLILSGLDPTDFPSLIAKGTEKVDGIDGTITYCLDYNTEIIRDDQWDFRDVMTIPTVTQNQLLAIIEPPTEGIDGMDVCGTLLPAYKGKPNSTRAGKGVTFNEEKRSFYATIEGEVSITDKVIQVFDTFNVNESLSMKTGNLDFIGSIIIRGNVPTGFTVKADGDIKVFGLVEAATLIAGGSIFISEGLAGLNKGILKAKENIHIGYINQGTAIAGDTLFVENSVIHSECTAKNKFVCQHGNIIGGSLSVGMSIEAKDVGNRLSTETLINLGLDKTVEEEKLYLLNKKEKLEDSLSKLTMIGKKLVQNEKKNDPKMRITLLRQKNSLYQVTEQINHIDLELAKLDAFLGDEACAELIIKNTLYSNVVVSFGKYKRKINRNRKHVRMKLEQNEIIMHSLE